MVDVLCAGLPVAGERLHAEISIRAGGSAVNAAFAAAAAGGAAAVVGRVGADPSADLVAAALAERGVESLLARDPDASTGAAVALADAVVAHRGANALLAPEDVPQPLDADALLVSGFALLQTGSAEAARAALHRFTGRWAAVDLASPKLAASADLDELSLANVLLATAEEAHAVTGLDPEEAARRLASRFEVVCVKLGAEGAIAVQGERFERGAAPPTSRPSLFGAGDAFAGALLVALARGADLRDALEQACAAGAAG